ncbi:T9SS type A sorting domain-containing protein [Hymenobacter daeguensis]
MLLCGPAAWAQQGKNGTGTITAANTVVNTYTSLSAAAAAGASTITVANSALTGGAFGTTGLAAGDFVMLIQMQGATIDTGTGASTYGNVTAYNNAGRYELLEVRAVPSATSITFQCALTNSYTAAGQVQVVRIPRYTGLTLNANTSIVAPAWNGTTGGIVALDVQGDVIFNSNAKIDVSGLGFRGGAVTNVSTFPSAGAAYATTSNAQGAEKGEGIAGSQTTYDALTGRYGRGAAANGGGGGNTHNAAGGGGSNVGTGTWTGNGNPVSGYNAAWNQEAANFAASTSPGGGRGGYSYSANNADANTQGPGNGAWGGDNRLNLGGLGGRPLNVTGRLFFGGGGGAGDANNGSGTAGGNGGGLIYILTGGKIGGGPNASLLANGAAAANNTSGNDAPGGGGGGGTIVLNTAVNVETVTVSVAGGQGGSHGVGAAPAEAEGPGGGGGGGYLAYTAFNPGGPPTFNTAGGANGTTSSTSLTEFPPNGATIGGAGVVATFTYNTQCRIVADVATTLATSQTAVVAGTSITYTPTVRNNSATVTATDVAPTVQLPAGLLGVVVKDKSGVTLANSTTVGYNQLTGLVTFPTESSLAPATTLTYDITFPAPNYTITITGKAKSTASSNDLAPANNDGTAANANVQTVVSLPNNSCAGTAYPGAGTSGLYAEYFQGYFADDLTYFSSRTAGITRTDGTLNYTSDDSWGNLRLPTGNPVASGTVTNPDTYSSRYRGSINITTAGTYTFSLRSDDASYMWLDGAALVASPTLASATINNSGLHSAVTVTATVTLSAGPHNVLIFFGENGGDNILTLEYSGPDTSNSSIIVPNSVLCPTLVNVPPVAVAVTNSPAIANTGGAATIAPLAGTDQDGTVDNYYIVSIPTAAQGVLRLGGTPVSVGQTITAAQAATLQFTPSTTFTGNATFTFQAIDNSGQRSNNTATYTIPVSLGISGTVFEDINYGGGLGRSFATANGVTAGSAVAVGTAGTPATAATVELYDGSGNFVATTQTSTAAGSLGQYTFSVATAGNYTVRVVNSTVRSTRTGSVAGLLPVQTYNGSTDRVGGEDPLRGDAAANTGSQTLAALNVATAGATIGTIAESQQAVTLSGSTGSTSRDFGYNFDVVTNTNNAGQGSLRQFLANANTLGNEAGLAQAGSRKDGANVTVALPASKETSIFMVPGTTAVPGLRAGLTSGLTGGVALITTTSTLSLTGANAANTVIDGGTQTFNLGTAAGNTAPGTATGSATATVGVDGLTVTALNVPEVEISGSSIATVLDVEVANATVRGLAIHGGNGNNNNTVLVGNSASATGYLFENTLVGVVAAGTRPAAGLTSDGFGIGIRANAGVGTVQNSFLAYTGNSGLHIDNGTGTAGITQILGNQFLQNGFTNAGGDGVTFGDNGGSGPALVQGNLFTTPNSSALQFEIGSTTATQVLNNSITGAGTGGAANSALERAGIVYLQRNNTNRGAQLDVISKNVITSSAAAGIVVGYGQQNVTISQNQISNNAGLGIDLIATSTFIVGSGNGYGNGDGVTVNDGNDPASAANTLPNRGVDFPVITSATVVGTNLVVKGYARPGAKIELFGNTAADPTGFGEGQTYLGTVTEGGAAGGANNNLAADTDPRTGLSYTNPVNGLNQGADASANGFIFSIPLSALPGGVLASGTILSSTATLNNSTSEFSGVVKISTDVTTTIAGPNTLAAGQTSGTFTATFSNAGNAPASAVTQTVTLPAGATLTGAQLTAIQTAYPGTSYSGGSGGTLTFPQAATLEAGASNVYRFVFTAPTTSGATSIGSNVGTSTTQNPNTAPDAATFALTVTDVADVVAVIVGTGTSVSAGTTGTFTATFSNNGPSAAAGTVSTVQLSPSVTNVTINSAGPTSTSGGVATYAGGVTYNTSTGVLTVPATTLPSSGSTSLTIGYTQPSQGNVTATATITTTTSQGALSANGNPSTANDVQTATNTGGAGFDLATTLAGPASVVEGTQVTYAVTTSNNGPGAAPTAVQTVSMVTGAALTNVFLSNGGTYSFSGGTSLFTFPTIPSLGSGQQVNNSISFTAPISAPGTMALTALATPNTATAGDANTTNNQFSVSTNLTVAPAAAGNTANLNVDITSNAPTGGVAPGAAVVFTVKQGNNGPNAATSVGTRVYLPTGLTGVVVKDKNGVTLTNSATSGYNSATGVVIFPVESTEASAIMPLTYTITANAPASGVMTATATVTASTNDPVPADNVALTAVTINQPIAGDVLTTLNGPATATPGESIVYTVAVTNAGTTAATGVTQTVQFPAGLLGVVVRDGSGNVITNSTTTGYNDVTGLVTFAPTGTLAAGASLTRTITLPAPSNAGSATGGSITPVASTSATSADNVPANNSASITTVIKPTTDFTVSLSGPATTVVGNPVTYTVTVTNNGASIGDQQATLLLPTGLDVPAAGLVLPTGASYNTTTGVVTLAAVTAQGLGSASAVTNTVSFNTPTGTALLTPTAQVTPASGTNDANLGNNAATATTTVTPATETVIDLATTVSANVGSQNSGAAIIFTVTSTNNTAGSSATNAVQQLSLAAGLTGVLVGGAAPTSTTNGVSTYAGGVTYDANTGVVTFPAVTLVNGTPLTRTVQVNAPSAGPLVAKASIKGDQTDNATANNSNSTSVTIAPRADLVTSTTGPATTAPGTPVSYSVITTNNGPSAALGVVPTITLPSGATNVVLPAGASLSGSTVTFATTGNLTSGQSVTNTVTFTSPAAAGSYSVAGTASTTTTEPTTANNGSTTSTTSTAPTAAPVAFDVVNRTTYNATTGTVNSPSANTAGQFLLSGLSAAASAGQTLNNYTITSIPNTVTQGTLYYNNGTSYVAVGVNQVLTPAQAASLKFDPADNATTTNSVGDLTFSYTVTDNVGKTSNTALFTIPVGRDNNSVYTATPNKGGTNQYQTNDVLAFVIDPNGAAYNGSGLVYNPSGTTSTILAAGGNNGLVNQPNSVVQAPSGSGPAASGLYPANPTNVLPAGVSLDPTTGLIYVSNRALLVNYNTVKYYQINVTTMDIYGGTNLVTAQFSIGAYPLPVELVAFTAKAVNNVDAALSWTTASEKNNDRFEVERSLTGTDYVKIGEVQGQGSKAGATDYRLTDAGIGSKAAGPVYYRLRQVDTDGTATYSPVRPVVFARALTPGIALYPNPATAGTTELDLRQLPAGRYDVRVLDATGRVVLHTVGEAGLAQVLDLNTIASGTYTVRVQGQGLSLAKRLIKE